MYSEISIIIPLLTDEVRKQPKSCNFYSVDRFFVCIMLSLGYKTTKKIGTLNR